MKVFLVVNPKSANGRTGGRWAAMASKVRRQVGDFGYRFTDGPMHAARVAAEALAQGYECIVAVGGDGTVNEVVNGFFDNGRARNPDAALAVIPCGTGGDFRRTFEWSTDLDEAVRRLATGRRRAIDVGLVEYQGHDGSKQTRYFANICSFGVSGLVDQEVNRSTKLLGGKVSFVLGTVKGLLKYRDRRVRLTLDGQQRLDQPVTAVAVANCRYFGGGMYVAPSADPSDGMFEVTVWFGFTVVDFALKARTLYDGSHLKNPKTRTFRCRELLAETDERVLLDVDGEQPGTLPCRMRVVPGALQLVV